MCAANSTELRLRTVTEEVEAERQHYVKEKNVCFEICVHQL